MKNLNTFEEIRKCKDSKNPHTPPVNDRDYRKLTIPSFKNSALYHEDIPEVISKLSESVKETYSETKLLLDKCESILKHEDNKIIRDAANRISQLYNTRAKLLKSRLDKYSEAYLEFINTYHQEEAEKEEHAELVTQSAKAFDWIDLLTQDFSSASLTGSTDRATKEFQDDLVRLLSIYQNTNEELYRTLEKFVEEDEIECVSYGVCNYAVPYLLGVDYLVKDLYGLLDGELISATSETEVQKKNNSTEDEASTRIAAWSKEQAKRSKRAKELLSTWGVRKK